MLKPTRFLGNVLQNKLSIAGASATANALVALLFFVGIGFLLCWVAECKLTETIAEGYADRTERKGKGAALHLSLTRLSDNNLIINTL